MFCIYFWFTSYVSTYTAITSHYLPWNKDAKSIEIVQDCHLIPLFSLQPPSCVSETMLNDFMLYCINLRFIAVLARNDNIWRVCHAQNTLYVIITETRKKGTGFKVWKSNQYYLQLSELLFGPGMECMIWSRCKVVKQLAMHVIKFLLLLEYTVSSFLPRFCFQKICAFRSWKGKYRLSTENLFF